MSAPTLWEEGRWSGTRVTRLSAFACVLLIACDLVVSGGLGRTFDVGFVLLCLTAALAIRPDEFFSVGVLPPMLLLGACSVLGVVHRSAIAPAGDPLVQAVISGLAHHSVALLIAHGGLLVLLAVRQRVYSKRDVSPAPYLVISAAPEVKSTTVVADEPHSPVSMTASNS